MNKARTVSIDNRKLLVIDEGFCAEYDNMRLQTSDPANKEKNGNLDSMLLIHLLSIIIRT